MTDTGDPWDYPGAAGEALLRQFRTMVASPDVGRLSYAEVAAMLDAVAALRDLDPASRAVVQEYTGELRRLHREGQDPVRGPAPAGEG